MTWFSEDCALSTSSSASKSSCSTRRAWSRSASAFSNVRQVCGVAFNGDVNRPGRGALPGKGLERLQGGPVRGSESQRDAGCV